MELLFLGTSSGTPTKQRNMSGVAIRLRGERHWSLVDCGEGTQHRLLRTPLSLMYLRAVFITHLHGDHCYGLPGLLASAGMLNRTEPLLLVGPAPLRPMLECIMDATQLRLPYPIEFRTPDALAGASPLPDFALDVAPLSHRLPSYSYGFTEQSVERKLDIARLKADGIPSGPEWGELQQGRDAVLPDGRVLRSQDYLQAPRRRRKIVIAGDNDTPALLAEQAHQADVLVHESTYTQEILDKVGPGPQHSSALQVARLAAEAGVRNLVLTHFSPRYQDGEGPLSLAAIEAEAKTQYGGPLFLARDLQRYVLDRQGVLQLAE